MPADRVGMTGMVAQDGSQPLRVEHAGAPPLLQQVLHARRPLVRGGLLFGQGLPHLQRGGINKVIGVRQQARRRHQRACGVGRGFQVDDLCPPIGLPQQKVGRAGALLACDDAHGIGEGLSVKELPGADVKRRAQPPPVITVAQQAVDHQPQPGGVHPDLAAHNPGLGESGHGETAGVLRPEHEPADLGKPVPVLSEPEVPVGRRLWGNGERRAASGGDVGGILLVDRRVLAVNQFVPGIEHGEIIQGQPAALDRTAHRVGVSRVGRLDHRQVATGAPADLVGRQPRLALEPVEVDTEVVGDQIRGLPSVMVPSLKRGRW